MGRLQTVMAPSFREVELFFEHLSKAEQDSTSQGKEIFKILKGSTFLILYNVAESAFRLCLEEIFSAIERSDVGLLGLSERITALYVREKLLRPISDGAAGKNAVRLVLQALLDAAHGQKLKVSAASIPISGNVDAGHIRLLAHTFGFKVNAPPVAKGGECLERVKNRRNGLGHGNERFGECGNNYLLSDLETIRVEFEHYLTAMLTGVESYIDDASYDLDQRLGRIEGLGESRRKALVARFGSPLAVLTAAQDDLVRVKSVGETLAKRIAYAGRGLKSQ